MAAKSIIITIAGGILADIMADGPITVTLVDHDNICQGEPPPALPDGVSYGPNDELMLISPWQHVDLDM